MTSSNIHLRQFRNNTWGLVDIRDTHALRSSRAKPALHAPKARVLSRPAAHRAVRHLQLVVYGFIGNRRELLYESASVSLAFRPGNWQQPFSMIPISPETVDKLESKQHHVQLSAAGRMP